MPLPLNTEGNRAMDRIATTIKGQWLAEIVSGEK